MTAYCEEIVKCADDEGGRLPSELVADSQTLIEDSTKALLQLLSCNIDGAGLCSVKRNNVRGKSWRRAANTFQGSVAKPAS